MWRLNAQLFTDGLIPQVARATVQIQARVGHLLLLILLSSVLTSVPMISATHICAQQEMACGAHLRAYPPMESLDYSSGWGSGMDSPVYDEFFAQQQKYDFSAPSNLTTHNICECQNNAACLPGENNAIELDQMVMLIFCDDIAKIFRRRCRGARSLVRVIGQIHESGEALTSVSESLMFCKCDRGYERINVEAWLNGLYAFIYRCL